MKLNEELSDYLSKIDNSRKDIKSIGDWWETNHLENEPFLLSGTSGHDTWKSLNILDEITSDKKILNIGVGLGYCTNELYRIGAKVHALDISSAALKRVEKFVEKTWSPKQLHELPENYFDLAISHLVAQHMSNADLITQIKFVIQSLKPDGFFAIQIAYPQQKDYQFVENFDTQKWGCVLRSLHQISELVLKAGGQIGWVDKIDDFPEFEIGWYGVHILKNNLEGLVKYQKNRLNKNMSKLLENEGDHFVVIGNYEKAMSLYEQSLQFNEKNLSALKKNGQVNYKNGNKKYALDLFTKARFVNQFDIEVLLVESQILLELGKVNEAYDLLIEYRFANPNFIYYGNLKLEENLKEAIITLSDIYLVSGLYDQFVKLLNIPPETENLKERLKGIKLNNTAYNINTDKIDIKLQTAELAIERKQYKKARILIDNILIHDNENVDALISLGAINSLENKYSEAEKNFIAVLSIEPTNEIAKGNLDFIKEESLGVLKQNIV